MKKKLSNYKINIWHQALPEQGFFGRLCLLSQILSSGRTMSEFKGTLQFGNIKAVRHHMGATRAGETAEFQLTPGRKWTPRRINAVYIWLRERPGVEMVAIEDGSYMPPFDRPHEFEVKMAAAEAVAK